MTIYATGRQSGFQMWQWPGPPPSGPAPGPRAGGRPPGRASQAPRLSLTVTRTVRQPECGGREPRSGAPNGPPHHGSLLYPGPAPAPRHRGRTGTVTMTRTGTPAPARRASPGPGPHRDGRRAPGSESGPRRRPRRRRGATVCTVQPTRIQSPPLVKSSWHDHSRPG
jgi:hypothetical protein